jgi:hypothetical protein
MTDVSRVMAEANPAGKGEVDTKLTEVATKKKKR